MGVSKNSGTPKSSILIGFSIMFTIHFGGFPPIFGNTHISVFFSTCFLVNNVPARPLEGDVKRVTWETQIVERSDVIAMFCSFPQGH